MDNRSHHVHVLPLRVYFAVWGALMVGTIATVAASFVHIGPFNVPIMLLIAVTKATLVALFFMHLWYDDKFNLIILLFAMVFVSIFFVGTLSDMLTRGTIDHREQHPIAAEMDRLNSGKKPLANAADHATSRTATLDAATSATQSGSPATGHAAGH